MSKHHVVKLTIKNSTNHVLEDPSSWFDSGRVADGWNIPTEIRPGDHAVVEMYEKDWSFCTGCSGYINYRLDKGTVTIAFSNPYSGSNKVGCGSTGKAVWEQMESHDYKPFEEQFETGGLTVLAHEVATGGTVNQASVTLSV